VPDGRRLQPVAGQPSSGHSRSLRPSTRPSMLRSS
jgi:hypothetical protein